MNAASAITSNRKKVVREREGKAIGMDVYGKNPTSKDGEYFRASMWSWPAIWDAAKLASPKTAAKVEYPYTNDGDGLVADDARKLGEDLLAYIEATQQKVFQHNPERATTTNRQVAALFNIPESDSNGQSAYSTDLDHVREFARFAIASGGFEIC